VIGHEVGDAGPDEGELDDEGVHEGRRVLDQVAENVRPEFFANFLFLSSMLENTSSSSLKLP
jgi:hypothetical protein